MGARSSASESPAPGGVTGTQSPICELILIQAPIASMARDSKPGTLCEEGKTMISKKKRHECCNLVGKWAANWWNDDGDDEGGDDTNTAHKQSMCLLA